MASLAELNGVWRNDEGTTVLVYPERAVNVAKCFFSEDGPRDGISGEMLRIKNNDGTLSLNTCMGKFLLVGCAYGAAKWRLGKDIVLWRRVTPTMLDGKWKSIDTDTRPERWYEFSVKDGQYESGDTKVPIVMDGCDISLDGWHLTSIPNDQIVRWRKNTRNGIENLEWHRTKHTKAREDVVQASEVPNFSQKTRRKKEKKEQVDGEMPAKRRRAAKKGIKDTGVGEQQQVDRDVEGAPPSPQPRQTASQEPPAPQEQMHDLSSKVRESTVRESKVRESKVRESKVRESKVRESKVREVAEEPDIFAEEVAAESEGEEAAPMAAAAAAPAAVSPCVTIPSPEQRSEPAGGSASDHTTARNNPSPPRNGEEEQWLDWEY